MKYGRARGSCGQRNMPCGDCNGLDLTSCDADLQCTELSPGDARCLVPCESDADCVGGLTTCQEGVCQPLSSF